jgi:hypothetical protein
MAAAQASRRVHFCFRRGEHRTAGQIEELGLDCFSHHADYVFFCEDPLLGRPAPR